MTEDLTTWIVVADGGQVRVLEERRRHGALHELADWAAVLPDSERKRSRTHGGTVHERHGPGRSSVYEASPAQSAESRFIAEFAERLDRASTSGAFERLVLIASPRCLGVLRAGLGAAAQRKIEASDPHDRVDETVEALRERLRDIRIPA